MKEKEKCNQQQKIESEQGDFEYKTNTEGREHAS